MSKNKLQKFAEMQTFERVFQCSAQELEEKDYRRLGDRKHALAGHWHEVFQNDHPIVLELGCGHGEYTVGLARRYPEKNFIGIDIKGARMWVGAKQAHADGLTNAAFLRTNIEILPYFFAPDEVAEIWITFPDPQMKKATKRLTSTYFMARYRMLLQDGGLIHLKTDSPFLYTYTREMLRASAVTPLADTPDLYSLNLEPLNALNALNSSPKVAGEANRLLASKREGWRGAKPTETLAEGRRGMSLDLSIRTHYEQQWLDRGLTIKYLQWPLARDTRWTEPDIDIEPDTYKSYGRGTL